MRDSVFYLVYQFQRMVIRQWGKFDEWVLAHCAPIKIKPNPKRLQHDPGETQWYFR